MTVCLAAKTFVGTAHWELMRCQAALGERLAIHEEQAHRTLRPDSV